MGVLRVNVGGTWLDVGGGGGGSDEVVVGPDDPIGTVPTTELWYDTDDPTGVTLASIEILYSEITTNASITATSAATAQNVINPGNVTYDGTPIMIEFFASGIQLPTTLNAQLLINLFDGNTDLGYFAQVMTPAASTMIAPVHSFRRLTPTPGAHNYNLRSWVNAGTGIVEAGLGNAAGTWAPAFMRVSRPIAGGAAIVPPAGGLEVNRPPAAGALMGLRYFATDTRRDWLCDGTGWIIMSEPAQTYGMNIAPTSGAFTSIGPSLNFTYQRSDGWLSFDMNIQVTTNGTAAGAITFSLPFNSSSANAMLGYGRDIQVSGHFLQLVSSSATTGMILKYDNSYPAVNGSNLYCGGRYRMASRYS